jgi:arylsulfatase A-like enzyme
MNPLLPCLLAGLAASTAAAADSVPSVPLPAKPNIIVILADDLGWTDLGCQGSDLYRTPNLDALASRGMRFTNAYAACPVCSPSRAALLTGQYPARLHLTDWIPGKGSKGRKLQEPQWTESLPPEAPTIAELLQQGGYTTVTIGKWHLGGPAAAPEKRGFQLNIGGGPSGHPPSYFSPYRLPVLEDGPADEYLTDRLAAEAVAFIEQQGTQPFFMYLPHYAVHTPLQAPKDRIAACGANVLPKGRHRNATYGAMVESLDTACGQVFEALRRKNLDQNTLVIFTSDNGGVAMTSSNAPLRGGKGTCYEGGVREPFFAVWPGRIPAGATEATPIIGTDLMPTLLAAAGLQLPAGIPCDGVDLLPVLTGTGPVQREALFWHYPHYHGNGATPFSAIRSGDWKLIEFFEDNHLELYHLANDVSEATDLAEREPARTAALHAQLVAWRSEVGAQLPKANPEPKAGK